MNDVSGKPKILLINPPYPGKPLGPSPSLGYLGSMIEASGGAVSIWDGEVLYSYRRKVLEVINLVERWQPDLIGFTLTTPYVRFAYNLAEIIKNKFNITLIAGGTHSTFCPEEVLNRSVFDIAVVGEGEITVLDLIRYFRQEIDLRDIKGIYYKDDGGNTLMTGSRPLINNLDEIPFPIDSQSILKDNKGGIFGQILTSRGCPGKCIFCGSLVHGKRYRFRSAENVFAEMTHYYKTYGITHFRFQDDALTINQERFDRLCKMITDQGLKFTWNCQSRADALNLGLLKQMKEAGCRMVDIGLESASPRVAQQIKKNLDIDKLMETIENCNRIGLAVAVNIMTGFPFEETVDIKYNIDFMKSISKQVDRLNVGMVLIPYPGTEVYNRWNKDYGFSQWWLEEKFTLPLKTDYIPLYLGMRLGGWTLPEDPVLEKDFFRYAADKKKAIKKFVWYKCWFSMKKYHGIVKSMILLTAFYLSKSLYRILPSSERLIMLPLLNFGQRINSLIELARKPRLAR